MHRHYYKIVVILKTEERPEIRSTLEDMLEANKNIISHPPKTFLEACQWMAWFNVVSRIYDRDGAGCNLDVVLYPFYKADIESGILDDEKATFILTPMTGILPIRCPILCWKLPIG